MFSTLIEMYPKFITYNSERQTELSVTKCIHEQKFLSAWAMYSYIDKILLNFFLCEHQSLTGLIIEDVLLLNNLPKWNVMSVKCYAGTAVTMPYPSPWCD